MVCTAGELKEWNQFPKGLRVLLLDRDSHSATEIRSNLEEMDYVVYHCIHENEALSAILNTPENFHIAIWEVCEDYYDESFKVLEASNDLPIIMTSNVHCPSTMMNCIALGAVEFLMKPLSEEKLRNIWQHVIHKAFFSTSKLGEASLMQLQLENEDDGEVPEDVEVLSWIQDLAWDQEQPSWIQNIVWEQPEGSDKSQMNQVALLQGSWESGDQMDCSVTSDCWDKDVSKSVETTSHNFVCEGPLQEGRTRLRGKHISGVKSYSSAAELSIPRSDVNPALGSKAKKTKKYGMQNKHAISRKENSRCSIETHCFKPIMPYPSYHPNCCGVLMPAVYPTWSLTNGYPANFNMRGPLGYPYWSQPGFQPGYSYTGVQADALSFPVMLPFYAPVFSYPQQILTSQNASYGMPYSSFDLQPNEEEIDRFIKEIRSKPCAPPPLGLKRPIESVLAELSKQGISTIHL